VTSEKGGGSNDVEPPHVVTEAYAEFGNLRKVGLFREAKLSILMFVKRR
jgi:hypothetical protein